jgi:putative transposase
MRRNERVRSQERWAHLRFSVVGPLLASPPSAGDLQREIARLSEREWRHPTTGVPVRFGRSTIERWYYQARKGTHPVRALERKVRRDSGRQQRIGSALATALAAQYAEHPTWSVQLHLDNLAVLLEEHPNWGAPPSYSTLRRYMDANGLLRRRLTPDRKGGAVRQPREVRSYEAEYVNGLWHLDFHVGSLKILGPETNWVKPFLLAILDDRSRLICHAQWYLRETAGSLVHALTQAFLKRGLPRAILSDNGSPMIAMETRAGLERLSILQQTTLPYSPHQNGKQEIFWAQTEGRLLAMLEGQADLNLRLLNETTQAWVEMGYHRARHSATGQTPLERWLKGPSVGRPCPAVDQLKIAFTASENRTQRKSDGTVSIEGKRFEVPARFRHLPRLSIRYAGWNLSDVWLMDERSGVVLDRLYPLDRARNAAGVRRPLTAPAIPPVASPAPSGIAPLLRRLIADYAASGLPPAYLPTDDTEEPAP